MEFRFVPTDGVEKVTNCHRDGIETPAPQWDKFALGQLRTLGCDQLTRPQVSPDRYVRLAPTRKLLFRENGTDAG
jgi:hypothetical protein